jgi:hypothetical protein
MSYQDDLNTHLAEYKRSLLGISDPGVFYYRGRDVQRDHILPLAKSSMNLLEEAKAFFEVYPKIKRHRYFHHLNSSQAFAFNLFFPYFSGEFGSSSALLRAFDCEATFSGWEPEAIPDPNEGSNIDICWWTKDGVKTLCEVKLSETDFGKATDDKRHRDKLIGTYQQRLASHLEHGRLEPKAFFDAYQFNRNVWHMVRDERSRLIFLLPRANTVLWERLKQLLGGVVPPTRQRISAVAVESLISKLCADELCPSETRKYANELKRKYVI